MGKDSEATVDDVALVKKHAALACKIVDLRYKPPRLALYADVEKAMHALLKASRTSPASPLLGIPRFLRTGDD